MSYKQYGIDGKEISRNDLQDKGVWCEDGVSQEEVFVKKYGGILGLVINPEKKINPYVPDLLNTKNNVLADLKTQNTPFFQAKSRFNYDPQFTVVFNGKDRVRYKNQYPDIEIYFAVDWQAVKFENYSGVIEVAPMIGVWFIPFSKLDIILEDAPYHEYQHRVWDERGNAKGSYILNLRNGYFKRLI